MHDVPVEMTSERWIRVLGKPIFLMENIRGRPKVSSGSKFRCDELYVRSIAELFAYLKT